MKEIKFNDVQMLMVGAFTSKLNNAFLNNIYKKWEDELIEYMDIKYYNKFRAKSIEIADVEGAIRIRKALAIVVLYDKLFCNFLDNIDQLEGATKETDRLLTEDELKLGKQYFELRDDIFKMFIAREPKLKQLFKGKISLHEFMLAIENNLRDLNSESDMLYTLSTMLGIYLHTELHGDFFNEHIDFFQGMLADTFSNLYYNAKEDYNDVIFDSTVSEIKRRFGLNNVKTYANLMSILQTDVFDNGTETEKSIMLLVSANLVSAKVIIEKLHSQTFTKSELNDMIKETCYVLTDLDDKEDFIHVFRPYLALNLVFKLLKKSFEHDIDLFFTNTDNIAQLENKVKELDDKKKDREIARLNKLLKEKDRQITRIEKQSKVSSIKLERELNEKNDLIQSLTSNLNDMLDVNIIEDDIDEIEVDTEPIKINKPISIVGGYPDLINKLRKNIPNLKWVDSISKINKTDVTVVFLTGLSTHGQRYRLDSLNIHYLCVNSITPNTIQREIFEKIL